MNRIVFVVSLLILGVRAWGVNTHPPFPLDPRARDELMQDTTPAGLARLRAEERARRMPGQSSFPESSGIRCIGRWPFGNSYGIRPSDHFDRDSLIFLESGSGIRILKCSNPALPVMVGKIDCAGILYAYPMTGSGVVCRDSVVYVTSWGDALEIFDIHDPAHTTRLGAVFFSGHPQGLDVADSIACIAGFDSVFRVVDVANLSLPHEIASISLPDFGVGVAIRDTIAFVACYHAGLVAVNIANPRNPQIVGSVGGFTGAHVVLGESLAYIAGSSGGLRIVNIRNPRSMFEVGFLATTPGGDVWHSGIYAYMSGNTDYDADFYVIDVSDPAHPTIISHAVSPGNGDGVWLSGPYGHAYTANYWEGLKVYNLSDPVHPVLDTTLFGASTARNIAVQDSLLFLADYWAGIKVISIADPGNPVQIGNLDTAGQNPTCYAFAAHDSFGYQIWSGSFVSVDISDPTNPRIAGRAPLMSNPAGEIAVRDSIAYVLKDSKFEIYNVARPRNPVLAGYCALPFFGSSGLCLKETLAYAGCNYIAFVVVNIADPSRPALADSYPAWKTWGVAIKDTLAFLATDSLRVVSIANPHAAYQICCFPGLHWPMDVAVNGNRAYTGSDADYRLHVFDITDPARPVEIGHYDTPDRVVKIRQTGSFLFAACYDGGLCIFDTAVSVGIVDSRRDQAAALMRVAPNPVHNTGWLVLARTMQSPIQIAIWDISGRLHKKVILRFCGSEAGGWPIDFTPFPPGVYVVSIQTRTGQITAKVVKR